MAVKIHPSPLAEIVVLAAATPGEEVCGLLFGADDRIDAARATRNVAADRHHAFEIDPAALFAALRAERGGGPRLIGHYHSHPGGSAIPSRRDLAAAVPGPLWLIVTGAEARLWRLGDGRFDEVPLVRG